MMKLSFSLLPAALALGVLSAGGAQPSPQHANNRAMPKPHNSSPVSTGQLAPLSTSSGQPANAAAQTTAPATPAPAPAVAPKSSVTLDAYISELATDLPLSKDEQTDVKVYYQDDGAKLQGILSDASLSPLQQTVQVDALRDTRNAKIEALLSDGSRAAQFLRVEGDYRVALVQLAAQGGLVPASPTPKVPEPTLTSPAQAEKVTPAIPRQDAVPGT